MGQATTSGTNTTISMIFSATRLKDVTLPLPYQDLGVIPEVVYDTDKPDDYGETPVSIDWGYMNEDMLNIINSEDSTLVIDQLVSDTTFSGLSSITEQELNKDSGILFGTGNYEPIDTGGAEITNLSGTTVISTVLLPDEDYPNHKPGISPIIPDPSFSYSLSTEIALAPSDMSASETWTDMYLSLPNDSYLTDQAMRDTNPLEVDTSDPALTEIDTGYLEASDPVPGSGETAIAATIVLPPNIIIQ